MELWIARDRDGRLFLHFSEPFITNTSDAHWQSYPYTSMIDVSKTPLDEMFKDLKPMEKPVRLKLK